MQCLERVLRGKDASNLTTEHAPAGRSDAGCRLRFRRGLIASKACCASGGLGIDDARGCSRGDVGDMGGKSAARPLRRRLSLLIADVCAARQAASTHTVPHATEQGGFDRLRCTHRPRCVNPYLSMATLVSACGAVS